MSGGQLLDQCDRTGRVGRIEHSRALHCAHHGEVFERHLGRTVGADLHASMRPDQPDVDPRDGAHPDEVVSPGQERRKVKANGL